VSESKEKMERLFARMLLDLTPARRLEMACDMFSTARVLAIAGLERDDPTLSGVALKRALLVRFYGEDLSPEQLQAVSEALEDS
jgi:hypothetical protein